MARTLRAAPSGRGWNIRMLSGAARRPSSGWTGQSAARACSRARLPFIRGPLDRQEMHPDFQRHIDQLDAQVEVLVAAPAASAGQLPRRIPQAGVYLFSEAGQHLYVGRSKRIRQRIGNHTRPSSGHNLGTFAFRLARQQTGRLDAAYSSAGSRQDLLNDPEFRAAFDQAKARVRAMDVRWIEEADPIQQTLLEVYAAIRLGTPYNDFDTH